MDKVNPPSHQCVLPWRTSLKQKTNHPGSFHPLQSPPWLKHHSGFFRSAFLQVCPLSLRRADVQSTADLKDGNVVLVVILSQQGDLWPLPERLLRVADCKVSGVKLEQSEHFYLYVKRIPEYKHVNLRRDKSNVTDVYLSVPTMMALATVYKMTHSVTGSPGD